MLDLFHGSSHVLNLPTISIATAAKMFWKRNKREYIEIGAENERDLERRRRADAGTLSKIIFGWILPLIRLGNQRELETNDFDQLSKEDEIGNLTNLLSANWNEELKKSKSGLRKALLKTFVPLYYWEIFYLCFAQLVCRMGMPVVLGFLLRNLDDAYTPSNVYMLTAFFFVLSLASSVGTTSSITRLRHGAIQARVALTGLIHEKALSLSLEESAISGIGEQTNLITNDLNRFDRGMEFIPYLVIAPIQILIALVILCNWIGWPGVAGLLALIILVIIQERSGNVFGKLRSETAKTTDKRIRLISELLKSLSLVKMFTWEEVYLKEIGDKRKEEVKLLKKKSILLAVISSLSSTNRILTVLVSMAVFVILGTVLTAEEVYLNNLTYMSVAYNLGTQFPLGATALVELLISIKRVQAFLLPENKMCAKAKGPKNDDHHSSFHVATLEIQNLSARSPNSHSLVFEQVNLNANSGELVAVVGSVGSGKSSLLLTILSEIPIESGRVDAKGSIAYVSQQPWLFLGTLRENITFGLDYEPRWYDEVLEACALTHDIRRFPFGDMTLVGDNGTTLSGGQQARINLARGVYANADIYLLDDVLSAVDVKVARHIFDACILGVLRQKCVLLVTHQYRFLSKATAVVQLSKPGANYKNDKNEDSNMDEFVHENTPLPVEAEYIPPTTYDNINKEQSTAEGQSIGGIGLKVFTEYITAGSAFGTFLWTVLVIIIMKGVTSYSDIFLKTWIDWEMEIRDKNFPQKSTTRLYYIGIYTMLVLVSLILAVYGSIDLFLKLLSSSMNLHTSLAYAIIRAPIRFLQTNNTGRVLTRFTADISVLDELIHVRAFNGFTCFIEAIFTLLIVAIALPIMIFPAILLSICYFLLVWAYLIPSATTKRLEGIKTSPLIEIFTSSFAGLPTIRGYKRQNYVTKKFEEAQDIHSTASITSSYMSGWIRMTSELLVHFYMFIVLATFSLTSNSGAKFGLIVTALLRLLMLLSAFSQYFSELWINATSIERVMEYTKIQPEAALQISEKLPPIHWPSKGKIRMDQLSMSYGNGPLVLKNITTLIEPKEKIGIIGRTGAGKSSLVAAIFRLVEKAGGSVHIDGIDISKIGLHDLRQKISIITQTPFLFSGTVRRNLDPFNYCPDSQLWEAIQNVRMDDRLKGMANGLDSIITDGGLNFSAGERQLLCLARILLSQNRILVLDEATSSIDEKTDEIVQEVIRQHCSHMTVLTIAHRLETVMDSSKIMILDEGSIIEFDSPLTLLENPNSFLYKLVQRAGPRVAKKLYRMGIF